MKTNLRNLFYIFIITFLLKNELTKGKVCYSGEVFANWNLSFVDSKTEDYSPTEIYVDYCDAVFTRYCSKIQKIANVSLFENSLNFSQNVGWGYHFYFKVGVSYTDKTKRNLNCHFWPKGECYTCKGEELMPCSYTVDLYRSSAIGECLLINKS